jgi:hypothetical protein
MSAERLGFGPALRINTSQMYRNGRRVIAMDASRLRRHTRSLRFSASRSAGLSGARPGSTKRSCFTAPRKICRVKRPRAHPNAAQVLPVHPSHDPSAAEERRIPRQDRSCAENLPPWYPSFFHQMTD